MMNVILQALYFMLPAYIANALPVVFNNVDMGKFFERPVDLGRKWRGVRIFGDNKTVKGFFVGVLGAVIVCFGQFVIFGHGYLHGITVVNYTFIGSIIIGFLLGFGALVGDAIKSFAKRRVGIEPGQPFPIFDQLDYVVGALLFSLIAVALPLNVLLAALIISPFFPIVANVIAYALGWKKVWW